jgi:hypothetical protein
MFTEEGISMKHRIGFVWIVLFASALLPRPASAAFHLMEIEQVIGGVGGDTTAQAVQLKMRAAGNNFLAGAGRLVVRDAAGNNPVTLSTFPVPNPANGVACREILLATAGFPAKTSPAATLDYTMSAIPAGYLAAGSLTFEAVSGGAVLWRVSWGDGAYSGPNTTDLTNGDGDNSPPFASALPSGTAQALRYTPACATASTSNATQYAVTAGAATFTNNALGNYVVQFTAPPSIPALPDSAKLLLPAVLGLAVLAFAFLRRRSA